VGKGFSHLPKKTPLDPIGFFRAIFERSEKEPVAGLTY
jgi:hypothetical protein